MEEQYKVLIAEDEKGLRDILSKFLQKKGFEVDVVGDGDSACHAVDEKVYDIIVLDIMMPGRNGKEVCAYIRKKWLFRGDGGLKIPSTPVFIRLSDI